MFDKARSTKYQKTRQDYKLEYQNFMRRLAMKEKRNLSAGDVRGREQVEAWRTHHNDEVLRTNEMIGADDETPTQAAGGTSAAHTHEPSEVRFNIIHESSKSKSKNKITHYINQYLSAASKEHVETMVKEDHKSDADSKDKLHTLQDWGSKDNRNKMPRPPGRNLSNDHSF